MSNNKIVLITGASSGIGKATALRFAEDKAKIIINYLNNTDGATEVAEMVKQLGAEVITVQADISKEEGARYLTEKSIEAFGTIDILINNAGGFIEGDEWNGSAMVWQASIEKNLLSVLNVSKSVIPLFLKDKKGVIINTSSRYSVSGQADAITYAASKTAIVNITQSYAKLLAPFGRANAVSPGAVNTGYWLRASKKEIEENLAKIPMNKFVEPKEVAELIYYLASDKAKMITGQNIIIDGGYSLI